MNNTFTCRRSKRSKYPLHRTCVRKIVVPVKEEDDTTTTANNNKDSTEQVVVENKNNHHLPSFMVGRLIEFCPDDDDDDDDVNDDIQNGEKLSEASYKYTIEWENTSPTMSKQTIPTAESIVTTPLMAVAMATIRAATAPAVTAAPPPTTNYEECGNDSDSDKKTGSTERWTESQVAIGIRLHQTMGLKVGKRFETGIFIGHVVNVSANGDNNDVDTDNDKGQVFYHIVYDDGDSEDFNEQELQQGLHIYRNLERKRKRTLTQRVARAKRRNGANSNSSSNYMDGNRSSSFEALYDKSTPVHTLILGTHPAKKSLREGNYFSNARNSFFWIAGDCLGFRRDLGITADGEHYYKLCSDLRFGESSVIPYEQQVDTLCQHGFALWDIIASCNRIGSLDSAIKHDKPNNIQQFVRDHPTIQRIVFANGKSGVDVFNRHFNSWWETGEIMMVDESYSSDDEAGNETDHKPNNNAIKCICALSVSPAAATVTYKQKRDFWDKFVYSPGLQLYKEHVSKMSAVTPVSHREQQQQQERSQDHDDDLKLPACCGTACTNDEKATVTAIITPPISDIETNSTTKTSNTLDSTSSPASGPINRELQWTT